MGSIESKSSSKTIESLTFAALVITESGMPLRSRTTWRFVPAFPLSVGFGPVFGPLFSRDGCRVQRGALPLYLVGFSETVKQNLQKALPYTRLLPLIEAPPAGDAASATHLLWEYLPRDAALEHEDDATQSGPVVHAGSTAFGLGRLLRQKRFDNFPQLVTYQLFSHTPDLPG